MPPTPALACKKAKSGRRLHRYQTGIVNIPQVLWQNSEILP
jgi:hypothetical protein